MPSKEDTTKLKENISNAMIHLKDAWILAMKIREDDIANDLRNMVVHLTVMEMGI